MSSASRALAEAALKVERERAELQQKMRDALVAGDDEAALQWARRLVGLEDPSDDRHVH